MSAAAPRTLADQLRGWSDERLAWLLRERPDLASPAPQDSSQLASRAGTRASVIRVVDHLSLLELAVLDAVVALGGTAGVDRLRAVVNADPGRVGEAVDRLRDLALLWGPEDALRPPSVASEVVGTRLSRLGSPAAALLTGYGPARVTALAHQLGVTPSGNRHDDVAAVSTALADPATVTRLLTELDDQARAILRHLEREGRDGSVESTDPSARRGPDDGPVAQLLVRGLLVARDRRHVAVPREVALCLREGRTTRDRVDLLPEVATSPRDQQLVDRTAAGAALEAVRHVELLLEHWGTAPPPALRTGGLGVRDLRAAAELLHLDQSVAALLVEVARAAGLVAVGPGLAGEPSWLPTDAVDTWALAPTGQRWGTLATAWLDSPRLTGLIGGRENNKPVNALSPDLERGWLVAARRSVLTGLAELPAGSVLAPGTGVASLVDRLSWQRPRRPAGHGSAVAWVVEESAVLGVTALGGLAAPGRALLGEDPDRDVPAVLEPLLPPAVDRVLLQADLTAVAPGPLERDLARRLATVADVESRGGATVYRFSESSVRRALDSGWSAGEVHDFVASSSRTPVPQALTYLVDDVARRFGTVRVGAVESFLRSDDEAALSELVLDPRAAGLRLRRIAPTVVV
ncbi:MAG: helicase-associated domain-containing protein, partial [Nocardioidaceae bacterium]